jgi:pantetheine-phosphate adenylyltransferase
MSKSHKALFPGTFDPPSLGHLDIIKRAASLFGTLYIGIGENLDKPHQFFDIQERETMLAEMTHGIPNLKIISFNGLVVDFAQSHHINFLVRGLRQQSDFDFEMRMAVANQKLGALDTVFLMSDPQYGHICSSIIHEIATFGRRLHGFVPEQIEEAVYTRLAMGRK